MEIKEYKYCLRCGRRLKNPIFQQRGYGEICWQKIKRRKVKPLFNLHIHKDNI